MLCPATVLHVDFKLRLSGFFYSAVLRWARGKELSGGGIQPGLGIGFSQESVHLAPMMPWVQSPAPHETSNDDI